MAAALVGKTYWPFEMSTPLTLLNAIQAGLELPEADPENTALCIDHVPAWAIIAISVKPMHDRTLRTDLSLSLVIAIRARFHYTPGFANPHILLQ
jgi:hypothetical protein